MRWFVCACASLLLAGCSKPVGTRVPRPDKATAGAITAAVAGALTLANPKLAGRKPESDKDKNRRAQGVNENVPAGVLDRLDHKKKTAAKTKPPCDTEAKPKSKERLSLVPKPKSGEENGVLLRKPCKPKPAPKKRKPDRDK